MTQHYKKPVHYTPVAFNAEAFNFTERGEYPFPLLDSRGAITGWFYPVGDTGEILSITGQTFQYLVANLA